MKQTRFSSRRSLVLEVMGSCAHSGVHPSADEVFELSRERMPRISLGTVYRNLKFLKGDGKINEINLGANGRFDGNPELHYHFVCTSCNRIADIKLYEESLNDDFGRKTGLSISHHRLEFFGRCKGCLEVEK